LLYEAAAQKERSDPGGAMREYRAIASGGGAWAANALFAAGRLAIDRGRADEGKRLLEDYLRRYPKGPNAEDAQRLLKRSH
jgi:TolA-binding protein